MFWLRRPVIRLQDKTDAERTLFDAASSQDGKRALWQVFARVLEQRLTPFRCATRHRPHTACDVLELEEFNEDDLYDNLDWLAEHQDEIEDRLFRFRYGTQTPSLYLYDVTSSYLEGVCNALAAFGYCRDGKTGKMQIVYGLLCDPQGIPVSIQGFAGNTTDTTTFGSQVQKVAQRFGGGEVIFVGDRGMIKGPQIKELHAEKKAPVPLHHGDYESADRNASPTGRDPDESV